MSTTLRWNRGDGAAGTLPAPSHQTVKRLKFVSEFVTSGPRGWGQYYSEDGAVFLRIGNISRTGIDLLLENIQRVEPPPSAEGIRTLVEPHDVLITITADIGSVGIVPPGLGEAYVNQHIALVRVDPTKAQSRFVAYAAQSPLARRHFDHAMQGGTKVGLGLDDVRDMPLGAPPLPTQKAIADFLDRKTAAIDALIEKKQKLLDLLAEKRAALINQAVTKGLDPNVPMKDSGIPWIGEVPAHWEVKRLKHCLQHRGDAIRVGPFGSSLRAADMEGDHTKVYNQRTVIDGDFDGGDNFVSAEKAAELESFLVEPGDILLTTRGTIGRVAIVPEDADAGILHPCLMAVRVAESVTLSSWVELLLGLSTVSLPQLLYLSNATTIEVIYSYNLRDISLPVPPLDEQNTVLARVARVQAGIDTIRKKVSGQLEHLQEYRTALITAAVTGQLDINRKAA